MPKRSTAPRWRHPTSPRSRWKSATRRKPRKSAEAGIKAAERALALKPGPPRYYRVLGTLYGQAAAGRQHAHHRQLRQEGQGRHQQGAGTGSPSRPATGWRAASAITIWRRSGGGQDAAIADMKKAIELDPKLADAYLWLGVSLRKAKRNAEARQAFQKSIELNPRRVWAKEQLDKTPAA